MYISDIQITGEHSVKSRDQQAPWRLPRSSPSAHALGCWSGHGHIAAPLLTCMLFCNRSSSEYWLESVRGGSVVPDFAAWSGGHAGASQMGGPGSTARAGGALFAFSLPSKTNRLWEGRFPRSGKATQTTLFWVFSNPPVA